MAKIGMRKAKASASSGMSLAGALLRIVAVGVAGGAALISGANQVGKMIENKQQAKLENKDTSEPQALDVDVK